MSGNDSQSGESRHRELLARLREMSERVARVEQDQRTLVELLRDFRDLLRLMAVRLERLDDRVERVCAWPLPLQGRSERIARHLRN